VRIVEFACKREFGYGNQEDLRQSTFAFLGWDVDGCGRLDLICVLGGVVHLVENRRDRDGSLEC
jgi:hypothetical protein